VDGILEIKGKTYLMRIRLIKYQIVYPLKCLLAEADWILLEEKELSEKDFLSYLLSENNEKTISATADFDRFREEGCYIDSYVEDDYKTYLDISLDLENLTGIEIMRTRLNHFIFQQSQPLMDRVIQIRAEIISQERNFKIQELFKSN
jgi:hypothetical protein